MTEDFVSKGVQIRDTIYHRCHMASLACIYFLPTSWCLLAYIKGLHNGHFIVEQEGFSMDAHDALRKHLDVSQHHLLLVQNQCFIGFLDDGAIFDTISFSRTIILYLGA